MHHADDARSGVPSHNDSTWRHPITRDELEEIRHRPKHIDETLKGLIDADLIVVRRKGDSNRRRDVPVHDTASDMTLTLRIDVDVPDKVSFSLLMKENGDTRILSRIDLFGPHMTSYELDGTRYVYTIRGAHMHLINGFSRYSGQRDDWYAVPVPAKNLEQAVRLLINYFSIVCDSDKKEVTE